MKIQKSDLISKTAPYAFAEVDKLVQVLKDKWIKAIDFGVGDPSSPTPDFVIESAYKWMKKHASTGYPSYIGTADFRQSCADYMKNNFGVDLDPDTEISSNIGSKEAIFHFPFGIVNPWDIVIIPTPWYPPMTTGTEFAHAKPYFVGLFEENDFLIDYNSIPQDVAEKAVMMWLNYPNSPTGKTATLEYYRGLIEWAHKNNIILAADEGCYIDMYFNENKPHSILEVDTKWILTFYSLSKRNNMTWWRTGFVAGDKDLVDIFKKVKTNVDSGTPTFIQEASIDAFKNDDHAAKMRDEYFEKQQILLETLEAVWLPKPKIDATFYVWQKAPEWMTGVELAKKLLDAKIGVVTTPWAWISTDDTRLWKNPWENFIRFALVPSVEEVKEACQRIKNNW